MKLTLNKYSWIKHQPDKHTLKNIVATHRVNRGEHGSVAYFYCFYSSSIGSTGGYRPLITISASL